MIRHHTYAFVSTSPLNAMNYKHCSTHDVMRGSPALSPEPRDRSSGLLSSLLNAFRLAPAHEGRGRHVPNPLHTASVSRSASPITLLSEHSPRHSQSLDPVSVSDARGSAVGTVGLNVESESASGTPTAAVDHDVSLGPVGLTAHASSTRGPPRGNGNVRASSSAYAPAGGAGGFLAPHVDMREHLMSAMRSQARSRATSVSTEAGYVAICICIDYAYTICTTGTTVLVLVLLLIELIDH